MNAHTSAEHAALASGLGLLREPVPEHLISKLPKGTKAQNQCDNAMKKWCNVCGTRHHPDIRHLDYVGHAAATHRLLDADLHWSWEPVAFDQTTGLPKFDASGGLWIRLTVCGVTRLGYGNADGKPGADAGAREKEVIGDAIRNAAMRFGLALDLWSKADLHADDDHGGPPASPPIPEPNYYSDGPMGRKPSGQQSGHQQPAAPDESLLDAGRQTSLEGTTALNAWWGKLTEQQRKTLTTEFKGLREAARKADGATT